MADSLAGAPTTSAGSSAIAVAIYVVFLALLNEIGGLPLGFYSGFLLERRYGLSNEGAGAWALDQVKAFVLGLVLTTGAASIVYVFVRAMPTGWWLPTGLVF